LSLTVEVEGEGIAVNNDINGDEAIELNGGLLPMEKGLLAGNVVVRASGVPMMSRRTKRPPRMLGHMESQLLRLVIDSLRGVTDKWRAGAHELCSERVGTGVAITVVVSCSGAVAISRMVVGIGVTRICCLGVAATVGVLRCCEMGMGVDAPVWEFVASELRKCRPATVPMATAMKMQEIRTSTKYASFTL
jgi:hypothetical protein